MFFSSLMPFVSSSYSMGLTKKSPFNRSELLTFLTQVAYSSKMVVSEPSFLTISSLSLQILTKRLRSFISGVAKASPWWKRFRRIFGCFINLHVFVSLLIYCKDYYIFGANVNINTINLNKFFYINAIYNIFFKSFYNRG